jgi:hypothetical protein
MQEMKKKGNKIQINNHLTSPPSTIDSLSVSVFDPFETLP